MSALKKKVWFVFYRMSPKGQCGLFFVREENVECGVLLQIGPFEAHEGKKGCGLSDGLDRMVRSVDVFVQQGGQAHHHPKTQD
jgi:hypothetical protein